MMGQVRRYDSKKGYGFIAGDDGIDYFVPYCNIDTPSQSLDEGYTVEFNAGRNDRGYVASNVRLL